MKAIRKTVLDYRRDTYLGTQPELNPNLESIDCAVGYSQWGTSAHAFAFLSDELPRLAFGAYQRDLFGNETLKPAIIERFGAVSADQLFLGHGSFNLAERLIHKLIEPGVMTGVGPQFNEIPTEFVAAGGVYDPIPYQFSEDVYPKDLLLARIARGDVSVVYIDNPNNPLGFVLSLDVLSEICAAAQAIGAFVLIDEAYGDFVEDACSAFCLTTQFSNVIVVRSLSKCLGLAACRVGYMAMSPEIVPFYKQLDVPFEPTLVSAQLGRVTLEDRVFLGRVRRQVAEDKARVLEAVWAAGFSILNTHPAVSIFTMWHPQIDVVAHMCQLGISTEPGVAFVQTHPSWSNQFCRVRIPAPQLVDTLIARLGGR